MGIEELIRKVRESSSEDEVKLIRGAYDLAEQAHEGQKRASGEPYITHPLAVASVFAELRPDPAGVAAAVLHDVPEDTETGLDVIRERFGDEVASLVDGVTKLRRIKRKSRGEEQALEADQAEYLRKMFLAMVDDIRVIIIKLSDRLHNMQTLQHLAEPTQKRIAEETRNVFAPLANRLGIYQLKWRLEDLAFRHLEPEKYREIAGLLAERREARNAYLARVMAEFRVRLRLEGIQAELYGRPKHIYSIYQKMLEKSRSFDQIYDTQGVRIIVDEIQDCYAVLGLVHSLWRPISGEFDDYVAMPKDNLYQSLHTAVIGPEGKPLEVQIRTHQMEQVAEYGIAAHWRYKEGSRRDMNLETKIAWLRQVSDWLGEVQDAGEFVASVETDVLPERVYVFTPRGDIVELPDGATPIDFAYHIHTEVGHRCRGAKADGQLVSLDHKLQSGEQIEILTSKRGGPSRDWLNQNLGYIRTARARQKIRQWFRRQEREENATRGRETLEREMHRLGMAQEPLEGIARIFKYSSLEDFLEAVGYGDISPQHIANRIDEAAGRRDLVAFKEAPLPELVSDVEVMGVGDLLTRMAGCCSPVPGDEIVGYITRGKGVTIHQRHCPNIAHVDETGRLIPVQWGGAKGTYPVVIRVDAFDRSGLLRDIASAVADDNISMSAVSVSTHEDHTATIVATIGISGMRQLSNVLSRIEAIRDVIEARRESGR